MNCKEFSHCITPAVDGRLSAKDLALFEEHARLCPPCCRNFEEERALAEMIRARVHQARVPGNVLDSILAGTCQGTISPLLRDARPLTIFHRHPLARPIAAFILSFAAVVYFFTHVPAHDQVASASVFPVNDIVRQSASNYEAVLKGEIVPRGAAECPDDLRTYFQGKTAFPVFVPAMKECTLVGGVVNEYHGMRLAHVLYKHGLQFIYLYQACRESVMNGDTLHLSHEAKSDLERTGWHCCTAPDGAAIVLWVRGRTICAAVAPMNGEHLMAHLAEADVPGAW